MHLGNSPQGVIAKEPNRPLKKSGSVLFSGVLVYLGFSSFRLSETWKLRIRRLNAEPAITTLRDRALAMPGFALRLRRRRIAAPAPAIFDRRAFPRGGQCYTETAPWSSGSSPGS